MPWHNQEQEEVYFIVQGEGEICVGTERSPIKAGQAVFMPPTDFHQLTNTGDVPLHHIISMATVPGVMWPIGGRS